MAELTATEKTLIGKRQRILIRRRYPQMTDPDFLFLLARGGVRARTVAAWLDMQFAAAAFDGGRNLLSDAAWALFQKALNIPLSLFHARFNLGAWESYRNPGSVRFGNSWIDVDKDSDLAVQVGEWFSTPISHDVIADFGNMEPEDAIRQFGFDGGSPHDEANEPPPILLVGADLTVLVGEILKHELGISGGARPYRFSITSDHPPGWIELNNAGELTLAPVPGVLLGRYSLTIQVADAGGRIQTTTVDIRVGRTE